MTYLQPQQIKQLFVHTEALLRHLLSKCMVAVLAVLKVAHCGKLLALGLPVACKIYPCISHFCCKGIGFLLFRLFHFLTARYIVKYKGQFNCNAQLYIFHPSPATAM